MRLVCFSDTHRRHRDLVLPDGDVLICLGDVVDMFDNFARQRHYMRDFNAWLEEHRARYREILFVAGNHEQEALLQYLDVPTLLHDQQIGIDGFVFYGTAWQISYYDCSFFSLNPLSVPSDIDILLTHFSATSLGIQECLARTRPRLHLHGHYHGCQGRYRQGEIDTYNVETYMEPSAVVIDLEEICGSEG